VSSEIGADKNKARSESMAKPFSMYSFATSDEADPSN